MTRRSAIAVFALGTGTALIVAALRRGGVAEPEIPANLLLRLRPAPSADPKPLSDRYHGDLGGFERRARTLSTLRPETRTAFLALANAEMFTTAEIGASGELSRHAAAYQSLLADPGADGAFKEIVAIAGPPGQLYGLAGVYFTDPAFFRVATGRFRGSSVPAILLDGCFYRHATVGEVARTIDAGALPHSFRDDGKRTKSHDRA